VRHKIEFSKIILSLVMLTYFIGLFFGIYVIIQLLQEASITYIPTALCGLFSYIGAPVGIAIAFYSNKAKAENVTKISREPLPVEDRYEEG